MATRSLIPGLVVAWLALAGACAGYSTQRLTDFPGARTVAVLPFENTGFRRDLALRLAQAVATEVRARTSLGMAAPASADLLVRGRARAEEVPVVLDEDGRVVQKRLEGWLDVEVVERATGRVLRQARLLANEDFRPGVDGESLEGSGTDEWARRIAVQVADLLERGF
jgi:hypothetical protein